MSQNGPHLPGILFLGGTFLGRLLGTLYRRTCPRSARPGAFLVRAWKRGSETSWRFGGSLVENEGMSTPFLRGPDFKRKGWSSSHIIFHSDIRYDETCNQLMLHYLFLRITQIQWSRNGLLFIVCPKFFLGICPDFAITNKTCQHFALFRHQDPNKSRKRFLAALMLGGSPHLASA